MERNKIGIAGFGKMGSDIVRILQETEVKVVVLCHTEESVERQKGKMNKSLLRKTKNGLLSEEEYQKMVNAIVFTSDINEFRDCDLVIEAITEDLMRKQEIMRRIAQVVDEECIIASNTSSLPLNEIFASCNNKARCLGIHFFYPVQVTKSVELNCTADLSDIHLANAKLMIEGFGLKSITLSEQCVFIFNKIISTISAFAMKIYDEGRLNFSQIDDIIKKDIMMFGVFELIDSTGFDIIGTSLNNYEETSGERYTFLYQKVRNKMEYLLEQGFLGTKSSGFLAYDKQQVSLEVDDEKNEEKNQVSQRLRAVILNDIAYYCNVGRVNSKELFKVIQMILGFELSPEEMFKELGREKISKLLNAEWEKNPLPLYQEENFSCYMD